MLLDIFLFPKATLYLQFFIPVPAILLVRSTLIAQWFAVHYEKSLRVLVVSLQGIFLIGKDMLRILEVWCLIECLNFSIQLHLQFFSLFNKHVPGLLLLDKFIKFMCSLQNDSQISGSAHLGGAAVAALAWARVRRGRFWTSYLKIHVWCCNAHHQLLSQSSHST